MKMKLVVDEIPTAALEEGQREATLEDVLIWLRENFPDSARLLVEVPPT